MSRRQAFNTLTICITAAIVIAADQISKALVRPHTGSMEIVPGWLAITQTPNFRGAFGLFGDNSVLLVAMAALVLVIFWFSFRESARTSRVVRIAFGMIVGGAIGNIVDRFHYGYVIDFINFERYPQFWSYTFNIADACITSGVILLILSSLVTRRRT